MATMDLTTMMALGARADTVLRAESQRTTMTTFDLVVLQVVRSTTMTTRLSAVVRLSSTTSQTTIPPAAVSD